MGEDPRVDKTGCFSLEGLIYEAGVEWIGKKIMVRFDPFDLSQERSGMAEKKKLATPASIGEYNRNVKKPVEELERASESKLLRLFAAEGKKRLKQQLGAFRLSGEVNHHDNI